MASSVSGMSGFSTTSVRKAKWKSNISALPVAGHHDGTAWASRPRARPDYLLAPWHRVPPEQTQLERAAV